MMKKGKEEHTFSDYHDSDKDFTKLRKFSIYSTNEAWKESKIFIIMTLIMISLI